MALNTTKGKLGEKLALEFLQKKGFKLVTQNWRYSRCGEIDIIAYDKNSLVFKEVKTRTSVNFGQPIEAVDYKKINKMRNLAGIYLNKNKDLKFKEFRFDAVGIILGNPPHITHYRNIYQF